MATNELRLWVFRCGGYDVLSMREPTYHEKFGWTSNGETLFVPKWIFPSLGHIPGNPIELVARPVERDDDYSQHVYCAKCDSLRVPKDGKCFVCGYVIKKVHEDSKVDALEKRINALEKAHHSWTRSQGEIDAVMQGQELRELQERVAEIESRIPDCVPDSPESDPQQDLRMREKNDEMVGSSDNGERGVADVDSIDPKPRTRRTSVGETDHRADSNNRNNSDSQDDVAVTPNDEGVAREAEDELKRITDLYNTAMEHMRHQDNLLSLQTALLKGKQGCGEQMIKALQQWKRTHMALDDIINSGQMWIPVHWVESAKNGGAYKNEDVAISEEDIGADNFGGLMKETANEPQNSTDTPVGDGATDDPVSESDEAGEAFERGDGESVIKERLKRIQAIALRAERSINDFYLPRMDALQEFQSHLPEPYRTLVCDILANGFICKVIRKDLLEQMADKEVERGDGEALDDQLREIEGKVAGLLEDVTPRSSSRARKIAMIVRPVLEQLTSKNAKLKAERDGWKRIVNDALQALYIVGEWDATGKCNLVTHIQALQADNKRLREQAATREKIVAGFGNEVEQLREALEDILKYSRECDNVARHDGVLEPDKRGYITGLAEDALAEGEDDGT